MGKPRVLFRAPSGGIYTVIVCGKEVWAGPLEKGQELRLDTAIKSRDDLSFSLEWVEDAE